MGGGGEGREGGEGGDEGEGGEGGDWKVGRFMFAIQFKILL